MENAVVTKAVKGVIGEKISIYYFCAVDCCSN